MSEAPEWAVRTDAPAFLDAWYSAAGITIDPPAAHHAERRREGTSGSAAE